MLASPVARYMQSPVFSIDGGASLQEALARLTKHGVSSLAVSDGGNPLAAVISRSDLLAAGSVELDDTHGGLELVLPDRLVREIAHRDVALFDPETDTVRRAAALMVERGVHRVFAAKGAHLYGVFSTRDVLRAIADERVAIPVSSVMSTPVRAIHLETTVDHAVDELKRANVTGLIVIDDHEWPVGVFTKTEALEAKGYFSIDSVERVMTRRLITLSATTALHHAAAQVFATRARHAAVLDAKRHLCGIVSGLDFARAGATSGSG